MIRISHCALAAAFLTCLTTFARSAEWDFFCQIQVDTVNAVYSHPASPANEPPPVVAGQILTGIIHLDDSIVDTDPSLSLGSYGNPSSGPQHSFAFLGTTYTGWGANQTGLGLVVANDQSRNLTFFPLTTQGDSLHLSTAYSSGGIGGTHDQRTLQFVIQNIPGTWLATDAIPTSFPGFDADTTSLLRFEQSTGQLVAPDGHLETRDLTVTAHFVSLTPIPEPSTAMFVLTGTLAALCLQRRR